MRTLFFTSALALATAPAFTQTCCDPVGNPVAKAYPKDEMQLLASTHDFQLLHVEPLPFTFVSRAGGEMTEFKTPDGKTGSGFFLKAKQKTDKYLFVFQEWWGLNDYIKQEAEKYYNALDGKVNVLALDLYDGKVATAREEAGKLMSSADPQRLESIVKGAFDYAGPKAQIATIGWCFGGMWSLKSAMLAGKQAVGCVMYYGMPEKDVAKLKTLNTDVLGIFATRDRGINPEVVKQFEQNMAAADEKVTIKLFDADHAFANPSNPRHDKAATAEAYQLSTAYLKKKLL
jgi:carboxymethylenebutenolidase